MLIIEKNEGNTVKNFWNKNFINTCINDKSWKTIFIRQWKFINSKTIDFKYKLLNRKIAVGQQILKWNREISPNCIFCNVPEMLNRLYLPVQE